MRSRRRRLSWSLLLALAVAAGAFGCSHGPTVRGRVVYPAAVPVRTYPRIWVTTGHLDHELRIAEELVAHLRAETRARVQRVPFDELEPMREAGEIPTATVVVMLEADLEEGARPEWTTRPETVCGPLGCYTQNRSYMYDVPTVHGELTMTVFDGPTARVMQRVTVDATREGADYATLRSRVVQRLVRRVRRLVDQRVERVEVTLLEVELDSVRRALRTIEGGDWHRGRELLEQAARDEAVRALPQEQRARVLYDLGLARRFDPATMDDIDAHFGAAEQALARAIELDPRERYVRALEALREHREQLRKVREQREATEHNYELGRLSEEVPPPPPGYEGRAPHDEPPAEP